MKAWRWSCLAVVAASVVACDGSNDGGSAATASAARAGAPPSAATSVAATASPTAASAGTAGATTGTATADVAPSGAEAAPSAAPPAPVTVTEEVRPGCGPLDAIPAIPEGQSAPPTVAEWSTACHVNNQEKNSHAKNCVMKIVREWLQITCGGDALGYEKLEGLSKLGAEYFEFHREHALASLVVRLKKNGYLKGRFCRSGDRASVFTNWPGDKDRPSYVALSAGSACTEPSWTTPP